MTRPIGIAGFDAKFAASDDPWKCRDSRFEALKRRRALEGIPLVANALDLACGDGAQSRDLARHALRVDAVDGSPAAIASARRFLASNPRIRLHCATLPRHLPRGGWHRILVSELAYYLAPQEIAALADGLVSRLLPGGELVAVHHVVSFDDARTVPSQAVSILHDRLARSLARVSMHRYGRYVVSRWRRRR